MRAGFWDLVGIDESRIITGPAAARIAWIPRESSCNDPLKMGYEIRLLANTLKKLANQRIMQRLALSKGRTSNARRLQSLRMKTKKKKQRKRASRRGHGSVGNSFVAATAKVQEDDYIDDDGLERENGKGALMGNDMDRNSTRKRT